MENIIKAKRELEKEILQKLLKFENEFQIVSIEEIKLNTIISMTGNNDIIDVLVKVNLRNIF